MYRHSTKSVISTRRLSCESLVADRYGWAHQPSFLGPRWRVEPFLRVLPGKMADTFASSEWPFCPTAHHLTHYIRHHYITAAHSQCHVVWPLIDFFLWDWKDGLIHWRLCFCPSEYERLVCGIWYYWQFELLFSNKDAKYFILNCMLHGSTVLVRSVMRWRRSLNIYMYTCMHFSAVSIWSVVV